jgi:hypothetical protein
MVDKDVARGVVALLVLGVLGTVIFVADCALMYTLWHAGQ